MKLRFLILFLSVSFLSAFSQKPIGKFLENKLWVGKPIHFALVYEHVNKSDLVFPDSNYNFKPFKIITSEYFPTKIKGNKSIDSVIYTLVTFDIDSTYSLSLPITDLKTKKKTYSEKAQITMQNFVSLADLKKPKVKSTTSFFEVPIDFNYPKIFYNLAVLVFSVIVFSLLFSKRLKRLYKLIIYNLKHREFVSSFKKLTRNPKKITNISTAIILWKNHMEWLLKNPYSTMTTKEITEKLKNERLDEALKEFDVALYGGQVSDQMPFAYNILYDIASETFKNQKIEFKNNLRNN